MNETNYVKSFSSLKYESVRCRDHIWSVYRHIFIIEGILLTMYGTLPNMVRSAPVMVRIELQLCLHGCSLQSSFCIQIAIDLGTNRRDCPFMARRKRLQNTICKTESSNFEQQHHFICEADFIQKHKNLYSTLS